MPSEDRGLGKEISLMPLKSKAQRRFMHARMPDLAKKFEAETPRGKKLPERVLRSNLEVTPAYAGVWNKKTTKVTVHVFDCSVVKHKLKSRAHVVMDLQFALEMGDRGYNILVSSCVRDKNALQKTLEEEIPL